MSDCIWAGGMRLRVNVQSDCTWAGGIRLRVDCSRTADGIRLRVDCSRTAYRQVGSGYESICGRTADGQVGSGYEPIAAVHLLLERDDGHKTDPPYYYI